MGFQDPTSCSSSSGQPPDVLEGSRLPLKGQDARKAERPKQQVLSFSSGGGQPGDLKQKGLFLTGLKGRRYCTYVAVPLS